jgi:uncharacterized BrkB/YihY/UPF0761 family membrane protein
MLSALAAATSTQFYSHNIWAGYTLVIVVCGAMFLWCCFVAWYNFAPNGPVKRREREAAQT